MCSTISENINFLNNIFYHLNNSITTGLRLVQTHLTVKNFLYKEKNSEKIIEQSKLILKRYFSIVQLALGLHFEEDTKLQILVNLVY
jgi:hypothetical protein